MSFNFDRLLNKYFIRESFLDEVINNIKNLTKNRSAYLREGLDQDASGLLRSHNYIGNPDRDLIYVRMYDCRDYLNGNESIKITPRSFSHNDTEIRRKSSTAKSYKLSDLYVGQTPLITLNIRELDYQFEISETNLDYLYFLKEEVSEEQVRHMMFCVFIRCLDYMPAVFDLLDWRKHLHLSLQQYCELIYEVSDPKNEKIYFKKTANPIIYTDYKYFVLYQMKMFFKTNDCYYLIKAASSKAKISESPLWNSIKHQGYKFLYLYLK